MNKYTCGHVIKQTQGYFSRQWLLVVRALPESRQNVCWAGDSRVSKGSCREEGGKTVSLCGKSMNGNHRVAEPGPLLEPPPPIPGRRGIRWGQCMKGALLPGHKLGFLYGCFKSHRKYYVGGVKGLCLGC